jgi:hypothetical protein
VEINTKAKSSDNTLTYAEVTIAAGIIVVIAAALVVRRRRKAHAVGSVQKVAKKKAKKQIRLSASACGFSMQSLCRFLKREETDSLML